MLMHVSVQVRVRVGGSVLRVRVAEWWLRAWRIGGCARGGLVAAPGADWWLRPWRVGGCARGGLFVVVRVCVFVWVFAWSCNCMCLYACALVCLCACEHGWKGSAYEAIQSRSVICLKPIPQKE